MNVKDKVKQILLKQAFSGGALGPLGGSVLPLPAQGIEGVQAGAGLLGDTLSGMPEHSQQALDYAGENPWAAAAGVTGLGLGAVGLKRALGRRLAGGAGAAQQATQAPGMMAGMKDMYSQGMQGLGKLHPNAPGMAKGMGALGLGYLGYKGLQGLSGGGDSNKRQITIS